MKLVLLGYMASGKTTIGKILAKKLQIPFIDLDNYISEKENLSIPEIFKIKGEVYFRKKETQFLIELLKKDAEFILALGGGTPCYGNNMGIINKYANSFYLKSSLQNTYNLLSKEENKKVRPLISEIPNENLKEFIAKHLFERNQFYEQATDTILIDKKSMEDIADEIVLRVK
ncbi:shikimate kinase [Aureibaculum sp. 2210JD6-5]|uniref:shikimate kinase n=1 Tax=Aureibaculum sp. 2210JD6-5 TaxID=3103957 RepID=UPI002AAE7CC0|nr:shikimate kinase [Aureibaculum sp. 2210JD6-5]MDY7396608.1 shikimate kinase [Aureibaculum sp. 2210JD6-5]